ncbi:MAG TPA: hypothetical protein PLN42_00225 [Anaerolineae bacterium]|nr:hypothetical protein [Anaerolineae bacterium]
MEISYSDIVAAHEAIKQLVARYKAEMSMDLALACARIRRQLEAEIGVYQEIRNDLILEFGDEIQHEGRPVITVLDGTRKALDFHRKDRELGNKMVKLNIEPLNLSGLEHVDADIIDGLLPIVSAGN